MFETIGPFDVLSAVFFRVLQLAKKACASNTEVVLLNDVKSIDLFIIQCFKKEYKFGARESLTHEKFM